MPTLTAYTAMTFLHAWLRKKNVRGFTLELKLLSALITVNIVTFYVKSNLLISGSVGGFVNVEHFHIGLSNIFKLRCFLDEIFRWWVGGFYAYVPIMIFAILGVISILDYDDWYNRPLLTWGHDRFRHGVRSISRSCPLPLHDSF